MLDSGCAVAYATEVPTETGVTRGRQFGVTSDSLPACEDAEYVAGIAEDTPWRGRGYERSLNGSLRDVAGVKVLGPRCDLVIASGVAPTERGRRPEARAGQLRCAEGRLGMMAGWLRRARWGRCALKIDSVAASTL